MVRLIVAFDYGLPPYPLDLLKFAGADARQSTRVTTRRDTNANVDMGED